MSFTFTHLDELLAECRRRGIDTNYKTRDELVTLLAQATGQGVHISFMTTSQDCKAYVPTPAEAARLAAIHTASGSPPSVPVNETVAARMRASGLWLGPAIGWRRWIFGHEYPYGGGG